MKILVISQYYFPEQFKITDICEELVKNGHHVTVLTGLPNYPKGEIYEGYKEKKLWNQVINDVEIIRCPIKPRKKGTINRFINYYSYVFLANKKVRELKDEYDCVFVFEISPVMQLYPALKYKKIHNIPVIVYCQDIWPEVLTVGGIKKESIVYKYYYKVSKKLYSKSDKILITSPSFRNYLNDMGIENTKIIDLLQHSNNNYEYTLQQHAQDNDVIDLLYTGNIGKAQNITMMIAAMKYLKNENVLLHIVGDGSEFDNCKKIINDNNLEDKVILYGWKNKNELNDFYNLADAMVVSLSNKSIVGNTIPAKLQDYMAVGKPILAAISGDACKLIEDSKCGIYCLPDSPIAFSDMILKYIKNKNEINKMGINGRKYFEEHFKLETFMKKFTKILED